jgi:flavin-dependent dehydrogenase
VRLEDGRLNIAAAFDLALVRQHGGPGPAAVAVLDEAGWPAIAKVSALPWRGTAALTRQRARIAGDRVLVLGDAAGYIEPFTGEGMAWALAAGAGVTSLADRAIDRWQPSLGRQWGVLHSEIVGHSQQFCRVVAQVLRHPALARALIVMLGQLPGLATPFVRRLNTLSPRKVIFS